MTYETEEYSIPEIGVQLSVPSEWFTDTRELGSTEFGFSSQDVFSQFIEGFGIYLITLENKSKALSIEISIEKINGDDFSAMSDDGKN